MIDFGIAKALSGASTMASQVVGTPAYMAPEQVRGEAVTPAVDVFAWAATVVFVGTGLPPFGADSIPVVVDRILTAEPDLGSLAGPVRELVRDCLAKDPALRPTARQILLRLLAEEDAVAPGTAAASGEVATEVLEQAATLAAPMPSGGTWPGEDTAPTRPAGGPAAGATTAAMPVPGGAPPAGPGLGLGQGRGYGPGRAPEQSTPGGPAGGRDRSRRTALGWAGGLAAAVAAASLLLIASNALGDGGDGGEGGTPGPGPATTVSQRAEIPKPDQNGSPLNTAEPSGRASEETTTGTKHSAPPPHTTPTYSTPTTTPTHTPTSTPTHTPTTMDTHWPAAPPTGTAVTGEPAGTAGGHSGEHGEECGCAAGGNAG